MWRTASPAAGVSMYLNKRRCPFNDSEGPARAGCHDRSRHFVTFARPSSDKRRAPFAYTVLPPCPCRSCHDDPRRPPFPVLAAPGAPGRLRRGAGPGRVWRRRWRRRRRHTPSRPAAAAAHAGRAAFRWRHRAQAARQRHRLVRADGKAASLHGRGGDGAHPARAGRRRQGAVHLDAARRLDPGGHGPASVRPGQRRAVRRRPPAPGPHRRRRQDPGELGAGRPAGGAGPLLRPAEFGARPQRPGAVEDARRRAPGAGRRRAGTADPGRRQQRGRLPHRLPGGRLPAALAHAGRAGRAPRPATPP